MFHFVKNILCPMNVTFVALLTFKNILCPMNVTFVALLTFKMSYVP